MQEDIKKIAEAMELKVVREHDQGIEVYYHYGRGGQVKHFNPYENPADSFMVLEALVKGQPYIQIGGKSGSAKGNWIVENYILANNFHANDLKHAICTAYLSLIGDKDNG